jgi:hypothetical protein
MKALAISFAVLVLCGCAPVEREAHSPNVEDKVKPAYLEPKEAELLAKDIVPIKINLTYPKTPSDIVEYSNGNWRYVISVAQPRGRSSVHGGSLLCDESYVEGGKPGETISTPFGLMTFHQGKQVKYTSGWWPKQEE